MRLYRVQAMIDYTTSRDWWQWTVLAQSKDAAIAASGVEAIPQVVAGSIEAVESDALVLFGPTNLNGRNRGTAVLVELPQLQRPDPIDVRCPHGVNLAPRDAGKASSYCVDCVNAQGNPVGR